MNKDSRVNMKLEEAAEILGVSIDTPVDVLKQTYRRLALHWHPDKCSRPNAKEKFQQVSIAYTKLITTNARRRDVDFDGNDSGGADESHEMAAFMRMFMDLVGIFNEDPLAPVDLKMAPSGASVSMMFGGNPNDDWSSDEGDDLDLDEDDDEDYDEEDYYDSDQERELRNKRMAKSKGNELWEPQAKNYSPMNLKESLRNEKLNSDNDPDAKKRLKNAKKRAEKRRKQKEKKQKETSAQKTPSEAPAAPEDLPISEVEPAISVRETKRPIEALGETILKKIIDRDVEQVRELLDQLSGKKPLADSDAKDSLNFCSDRLLAQNMCLPFLHACVDRTISTAAPNEAPSGSASDKKRATIAQLLLDCAALSLPIDMQNIEGLSALHLAARYGDLAVMRVLLGTNPSMSVASAAFDINAPCSQRGWAPLHYAASGCSIDMCRLLLAHGASPVLKSVAVLDAVSPQIESSTPLDVANAKLNAKPQHLSKSMQQNLAQLIAEMSSVSNGVNRVSAASLPSATQSDKPSMTSPSSAEKPKPAKTKQQIEKELKDKERELKEKELLERKQKQLREKQEKLEKQEKERLKEKAESESKKKAATSKSKQPQQPQQQPQQPQQPSQQQQQQQHQPQSSQPLVQPQPHAPPQTQLQNLTQPEAQAQAQVQATPATLATSAITQTTTPPLPSEPAIAAASDSPQTETPSKQASSQDNEQQSGKKSKKKKDKPSAETEKSKAMRAAPTTVIPSIVPIEPVSRDELLDHLLAMGFPEADCMTALSVCGKDMDLAITWLCEHPPGTPAPSKAASSSVDKPIAKVPEAAGPAKATASSSTPTKAQPTATSNPNTPGSTVKLQKDKELKEEMRRINRAWNAKAEDEKKKAEQERLQKEAERQKEVLAQQQMQKQAQLQQQLMQQQQLMHQHHYQQAGMYFGSGQNPGFGPAAPPGAYPHPYNRPPYHSSGSSSQFQNSYTSPNMTGIPPGPVPAMEPLAPSRGTSGSFPSINANGLGEGVPIGTELEESLGYLEHLHPIPRSGSNQSFGSLNSGNQFNNTLLGASRSAPSPKSPTSISPILGASQFAGFAQPPPGMQWEEFPQVSSSTPFKLRGSEKPDSNSSSQTSSPRFIDGTIELSAGAPVFVPKTAAFTNAAPLPAAQSSFASLGSSGSMYPPPPANLSSAPLGSFWGNTLSGQSDLSLGNSIGLGDSSSLSLGLGLSPADDLWLGTEIAANGSSSSSLPPLESSHFSAFLSNPLDSLSATPFGSSLAGLRGDTLLSSSSSLLNPNRGNSEESLMSHFSNPNLDYLAGLSVDPVDDSSNISKLISQFVDSPNEMPLLDPTSKSLSSISELSGASEFSRLS